jgi:hypothetical protein
MDLAFKSYKSTFFGGEKLPKGKFKKAFFWGHFKIKVVIQHFSLKLDVAEWQHHHPSKTLNLSHH